jgi:hypothetical protein
MSSILSPLLKSQNQTFLSPPSVHRKMEGEQKEEEEQQGD